MKYLRELKYAGGLAFAIAFPQQVFAQPASSSLEGWSWYAATVV